jgi:hypothetical protein
MPKPPQHEDSKLQPNAREKRNMMRITVSFQVLICSASFGRNFKKVSSEANIFVIVKVKIYPVKPLPLRLKLVHLTAC